MTGRSKLLLVLFIIFLIFIALQSFFYMSHRSDSRNNTSLLNQYYLLQKKDPVAAKRALEIIIKNNPNDKIALHELAYWYLDTGNTNEGLKWLKIAHENDPRDYQLAMELAKQYWIIGNNSQASDILKEIITSAGEPMASRARDFLLKVPTTNTALAQAPEQSVITPMQSDALETAAHVAIMPKIEIASMQAFNIPELHFQGGKDTLFYSVSSPAAIYQTTAQAAKSTISERDQMLNKFYDLKKKNSPAAWEVIRQGAEKYPDDVQVLKEAGYYALLTLKQNKVALDYFIRVYVITKDPKIALQIAYIDDGLGEHRTAYHYFDLATHTTNLQDRMTAELAKSNLRGVQTKFLPYPYEATLYYAPMYMSRFKLLIRPIIFHLGMTVNKPYNWKVYLSYRRTSDDRSNTNNQVSSIYEDNAAITAIGTQLTPFKSIPQLVAFSELGKAVDLVYRNRSRWRTDYRGGLVYYNEWGFKPSYTFKPTFTLKPNADIYADAIYFTRYTDAIGTCRLRPGVQVFRWGSTSVNLYYRMFLIEDTERQFYNNIFEQGPGVAIRFSDRYNVVLRYEQNHGYYLPAASPSVNPYSQKYYNGVTRLDTYFEF